jgi:hypothetical protein
MLYFNRGERVDYSLLLKKRVGEFYIVFGHSF